MIQLNTRILSLINRATLISLLLVIVTQHVNALPDDAQQNMSISADDYIFNVKTSTTTFVGNVVLQQGSLKINASKIIYYGKFDTENPSTTDKIVATGKPARFQQTPKIDTPPVVAQANRLEYSVKDESLFLIDNASLDQDGSSLRGNRIEYDVQQALVRASGNNEENQNDGRIRMVIPPKKLSAIEANESKNKQTESDDEAPKSPITTEATAVNETLGVSDKDSAPEERASSANTPKENSAENTPANEEQTTDAPENKTQSNTTNNVSSPETNLP